MIELPQGGRGTEKVIYDISRQLNGRCIPRKLREFGETIEDFLENGNLVTNLTRHNLLDTTGTISLKAPDARIFTT